MLPSVPLRDLASAGSTRLEVPLRLRGRPAPSLKVRRGTGPNAATRWVAHLAQCGRYRPGAFAHGRAGRQAIATAAPLRSGILHALRGLLSGSSPLSWSSPLWVPSLNHLPSTAPLGADSLLHTTAGNPIWTSLPISFESRRPEVSPTGGRIPFGRNDLVETYWCPIPKPRFTNASICLAPMSPLPSATSSRTSWCKGVQPWLSAESNALFRRSPSAQLASPSVWEGSPHYSAAQSPPFARLHLG